MFYHMDQRTVRHYDEGSVELAAKYESADMSEIHEILLRCLPEGGRILEIGCGSGRDAAFMASRGFDVTAMDPSSQMLAAAANGHPELRGRLHQASLPLPAESPLLNQQFQGLVSIATVMHIPEQDLFECASQMRDLLAPGGVLVLSASIGREDIEGHRDVHGRLFVERPAEELRLLWERLGFRLVARYENDDSFSRSIKWYVLVLQRGKGESPRSIDEIETIITRDRKVATYKLALLRALCEIAQTESRMVTWRSDGAVSVPLGLIAEKWLLYYWPIIELDLVQDEWAVMPQIQGGEGRNPIAFRRPMHELISLYQNLGGLSALYHDFKAGTVPPEGQPLVDSAMNAISRTIVAGPVTYSGGALEAIGGYFGFEGRRSAKRRCTSSSSASMKLGAVLVPVGAWREMVLIGHWVAESIVLRWAELTHQLSHRTVPVKDVVERLLILPESDRDVRLARSVYDQFDGLRCVWTDEALAGRYAVDHTVPFSVWHNNDLWNLLPAAPSVNSRKSDKLVTKGLLVKKRDSIISYWQALKAVAESRFTFEVERSLVRGSYNPAEWEGQAFAGLVENVEILAIQRGLERWEP